MAVNNILFPSGNWQTRFSGGQDMGWNAINPNIGLDGMAQAIVDNGAGENASHAIPSPIAHLKDFKKRLDANDERALNEWRGMLAVIALRKARGFAVSVRDISLDQTNLGRVFFDTLVDNADVTGYADGENVKAQKMLTVFFMKNQQGQDKAFAMFMPSIGICPFKAYPADIFKNVPWYDAKNGRWNDLKSTIAGNNNAGNLTPEEVKLVNWSRSFSNILARGYFDSFKRYIDPNGNNANQGGAPSQDDAMQTCAWAEWKNCCPVPACIPKKQFSDKLLLLLADNDDNRVDPVAQSNGFVPKKIEFNDNGTKMFYAIPPIDDEVINKLRSFPNQLSLENDSWNIEHNDDYTCFTVSFCLVVNGGGRFEYHETYNADRIAVVFGMPYISMWPKSDFGNNRWRDYLISILTDPNDTTNFPDEQNTAAQGPARNIIDMRGVMKIDASGKDKNIFEISVMDSAANAQPKRYDCTSSFVPDNANGQNGLTFSMIKSQSKPFALTFKYNDPTAVVSLGSWVIAPTQRGNINANNNNRTMVVSMDFGTTSTNVYISDPVQNGQVNLAPVSISSPGKYVEDIYQPCPIDKRDFYQNYYLFSKDGSPLNKISTLGQIFNTVEVQPNQINRLNNTIHNISGRFIKADKEYMLERYGNANANRNTGIYSNLKWPEQGAAQNNAGVDSARDNFIESLLISAVLEAADMGATAIDLRVSYPSNHLGGGITQKIGGIATDLQRNSGLTIAPFSATEARCAGEFFKKNAPNGLSPRNGYAVVDIGGGTTDISFWKEVAVQVNNNAVANNATGDARVDAMGDGQNQAVNNGQQIRETKVFAECSFKYAGRDIIEKTIIVYFDRNQNNFDDFWTILLDQDFTKLKDSYNAINPRNYANMEGYYIQKGEILNALLAESGINMDDNLKSAISFKYHALFYLISNYFRNNDSVELSDNRFDLCLAGCGSHLMGDLGIGFANNLPQALCNGLGLNNAYIGVCNPSLDIGDKSKSEVVKGLAALPNNANAGAAVAPNNANANAADDAANQKVNEPDDTALAKAYRRLLDFVGEYYQENNFLTRINTDRNAGVQSIWFRQFKQIKDKVSATHCEPEVFEDLFAVYMLDEVINQLL